jgi:hypothetical protein
MLSKKYPHHSPEGLWAKAKISEGCLTESVHWISGSEEKTLLRVIPAMAFQGMQLF